MYNIYMGVFIGNAANLAHVLSKYSKIGDINKILKVFLNAF
jgi:hypothetical protein